MQEYKNRYGESPFPLFLGVFGAWMTFKKAVKYEWNGPPQPQMVGFRDLVGTGIAPVSKKPAVNIIM